MLRKQGMPDRDAMFAMVDHFNSQHWHDRDRYGQEIKQLKEQIERLREQIPGNKDNT